MTTRESTDISITVRPGDANGIEAYRNKLVTYLDEQCEKYVIAVEQKGDLSTEHFQCACVFKISKRANNLKTSLVGLLGENWTDEQKRHAVFCTKHHDITALAGGYCMKQDDDPLIKGFTIEELDEGNVRYEQAKDAKDKRNLNRESVIIVLQQLNDELEYNENSELMLKWEHTPNRSRLYTLFQLATAKGYDMQKFYNPNWLNYLINHYDTVIRRVNAERILEQFLRT